MEIKYSVSLVWLSLAAHAMSITFFIMWGIYCCYQSDHVHKLAALIFSDNWLLFATSATIFNFAFITTAGAIADPSLQRDWKDSKNILGAMAIIIQPMAIYALFESDNTRLFLSLVTGDQYVWVVAHLPFALMLIINMKPYMLPKDGRA